MRAWVAFVAVVCAALWPVADARAQQTATDDGVVSGAAAVDEAPEAQTPSPSGRSAARPRASDVLKPPRKVIASPITDRFAMRGSYFSSSLDTDLRLDESAELRGTPLLVEDDLGLDDELNQGRLELMVRPLERWRVRLDYFKADRDGAIILDRTIDVGDETFVVGEEVESAIDWRMLGFTFLYSLLKRDRFEIAIGGGAHLLDAQAFAEVEARLQREEASGVGGFPTAAVEGTWLINERISLNGRAQYFSARVSDFDGSISDYHADVQYRWRQNVAFGLGYSIMQTKLDVSDEDGPWRFALDVKGPEAFVRISF